MRQHLIVILTLFLCTFLHLQAQDITGTVIEKEGKTPLIGAIISFDNSRDAVAVTDINGHFTLRNGSGRKIRIKYVGYTTLTATAKQGGVYAMSEDVKSLDEVVVTAQESHGLSSSSTIQRKAMEHLQPSSFADLLELIPGGRATDPSLSTPNIISLREVPISSGDYNTSALGTRFVVDGAPISTNANMQFLSGAVDSKSTSRDFTNSGVDMRTLSTDDIDQVEIVRGIPSVEYGDLTSGLVKIKRRKGGNDISARFKADMDTKLFYAAKGFEWKPQRLSLNLSADYLINKADPRNILETYNRLSISARLNKQWTLGSVEADGSLNFDYGGSFDKDKVDPELNYGGVDRYKQSYNRYAVNASMNFHNTNQKSFFRGGEFMAALSYEHDMTDRTRLVQINGETAAATSKEEGEHDAVLIYPYTYTASQSVDGRPFSLYLKANATFSIPSNIISNRLLLGSDYQFDKNYGHGQQFDPLHPLYPGTDSRQRSYSAIPGTHDLAFYAEERLGVNFGRHRLEIQAGIRSEQLLGLDKQYTMQGHVYLDPRVNIGWTFPSFKVFKRQMIVSIDGGIGQHTKFPTIDQLYPDMDYIDLVEMNYYHENRDYRRMVLQTYVSDPTNFQLHPARNLKWEVRGNIAWAGCHLSVTYFREDMKSGFRGMTRYAPYSYKYYDTSGIDASALTAQPDYTTLPYETRTVNVGRVNVLNGSRTLKRGIEYTFATPRFKVINTRLTITGAWFKTEYHNSLPVQWKPSQMVNGRSLQVVGIYNDDDGYIREMTNTNFTFDTDIPKLSLGISLSAQCLWETANQTMFKESLPYAYLDAAGNVHPYTADMASDEILQYLDRHYNSSLYDRQTVPFSMNLNLKATKRLFRDKMMIALFVNKLLDAHPSYERNGFLIRRYVTPYFGVEMNVHI